MSAVARSRCGSSSASRRTVTARRDPRVERRRRAACRGADGGALRPDEWRLVEAALGGRGVSLTSRVLDDGDAADAIEGAGAHRRPACRPGACPSPPALLDRAGSRPVAGDRAAPRDARRRRLLTRIRAEIALALHPASRGEWRYGWQRTLIGLLRAEQIHRLPRHVDLPARIGRSDPPTVAPRSGGRTDRRGLRPRRVRQDHVPPPARGEVGRTRRLARLRRLDAVARGLRPACSVSSVGNVDDPLDRLSDGLQRPPDRDRRDRSPPRRHRRRRRRRAGRAAPRGLRRRPRNAPARRLADLERWRVAGKLRTVDSHESALPPLGGRAPLP